MVGALVALGGIVGAVLVATPAAVSATPSQAKAPARIRGVPPPPPAGYFRLRPVGAWRKLPGDRICAGRVHKSPWEPRPQNTVQNHHMPTIKAVHRAFASRKRDLGSFDRRWNTWLLPRVDGRYTGTTDEIFQWAACKWGLPDNLLRAIAVRESTWYEYLHFKNGTCYVDFGCGDVVDSTSPATTVFCNMQAKFGFDYQKQFGAGRCPETFSIAGVMSWQDPSWGKWPQNQNGTFPFNRNSTAFALDYLGGELRGCFEGWEKFLGDHGSGYRAGRLWGCVGEWYAGDWLSSAAKGYISRVQNEFNRRIWRRRSFRTGQFDCDPIKGCPI